MIICPKCKNDNGSMIEISDHRREQMRCFCQVCSHDWVEIFRNVVREDIIPKENRK